MVRQQQAASILLETCRVETPANTQIEHDLQGNEGDGESVCTYQVVCHRVRDFYLVI
jgi:hypothetical protein